MFLCVVSICCDGAVLSFSSNGTYRSKTAPFSTPPCSVFGVWLLLYFQLFLGSQISHKENAPENSSKWHCGAFSPQCQLDWVRQCSACPRCQVPIGIFTCPLTQAQGISLKAECCVLVQFCCTEIVIPLIGLVNVTIPTRAEEHCSHNYCFLLCASWVWEPQGSRTPAGRMTLPSKLHRSIRKLEIILTFFHIVTVVTMFCRFWSPKLPRIGAFLWNQQCCDSQWHEQQIYTQQFKNISVGICLQIR